MADAPTDLTIIKKHLGKSQMILQDATLMTKLVPPQSQMLADQILQTIKDVLPIIHDLSTYILGLPMINAEYQSAAQDVRGAISPIGDRTVWLWGSASQLKLGSDHVDPIMLARVLAREWALWADQQTQELDRVIHGNFGGNFAGFFLTHRIKAQKIRGKFRAFFIRKSVAQTKIFRAKFTLQTCTLIFSLKTIRHKPIVELPMCALQG